MHVIFLYSIQYPCNIEDIPYSHVTSTETHKLYDCEQNIYKYERKIITDLVITGSYDVLIL